jgi:formate/nitrite transporter FocA (FNT family)
MALILIALGVVFAFLMGKDNSNDQNNTLFIIANIYFAAAMIVLI